MADITITDRDDRTLLVSPYNADMIKAAKQLGGRWDSANHAWTFDIRDHDRVEQLAAKYYGYTPDSTGEAVTIRIKASDYYTDDEIVVAGRVIAHRTYRDYPVRLAQNSVVVSGSFDGRGGSMKHPAVSWPYDDAPTIEIRDLPTGVIALLDEGGKPYELVEDDHERMLREERDRLVRRIEEIDRQLAAHHPKKED